MGASIFWALVFVGIYVIFQRLMEMRPKKEKPKVKTGNHVVSIYFGPQNSLLTIQSVSANDTKQFEEIDYSKKAICMSMSDVVDGQLKSRIWIPIKSINLVKVEDEYKVKGEK